eukprot:scaffold78070_cov23-Tisochrysis_lutea.AAC.6
MRAAAPRGSTVRPRAPPEGPSPLACASPHLDGPQARDGLARAGRLAPLPPPPPAAPPLPPLAGPSLSPQARRLAQQRYVKARARELARQSGGAPCSRWPPVLRRPTFRARCPSRSTSRCARDLPPPVPRRAQHAPRRAAIGLRAP